MADSSTHLLGGSGPPQNSNTDKPLYHDSAETPSMKLWQHSFIGIVVVMVLISIILCIYRGAVVGVNGGLYFMLGISLVGFVAIELLMAKFIKSGDLPRNKTWFLYFVGCCIILEAIFTNVLLFQ